MILHKLQFNEILKELKSKQVYSKDKYINFDYDSGYIYLSFSFCLDFAIFDSLGMHINDEEAKLTNEQLNEIHKEIMFKSEMIEVLKQEEKDLLKHGELGF